MNFISNEKSNYENSKFKSIDEKNTRAHLRLLQTNKLIRAKLDSGGYGRGRDLKSKSNFSFSTNLTASSFFDFSLQNTDETKIHREAFEVLSKSNVTKFNATQTPRSAKSAAFSSRSRTYFDSKSINSFIDAEYELLERNARAKTAYLYSSVKENKFQATSVNTFNEPYVYSNDEEENADDIIHSKNEADQTLNNEEIFFQKTNAKKNFYRRVESRADSIVSINDNFKEKSYLFSRNSVHFKDDMNTINNEQINQNIIFKISNAKVCLF